jgi:hypothetical protein
MFAKLRLFAILFFVSIITSLIMVSCDDKEETVTNNISCPGFPSLNVDVLLNGEKLALTSSIYHVDKTVDFDITSFRISAIGETCKKQESIDITLYTASGKPINGTYIISEPLSNKVGNADAIYVVQQFSPIFQDFSLIESGTVKVKEEGPKKFTIDLIGKTDKNQNFSMNVTHTFD